MKIRSNTYLRTFLLLGITTGLVLSGSALRAQYFMFGPKAGVQAISAGYQDKDAKDLFDPKIKAGMLAGIDFNLPLLKDFNLAPEFNYSMKGRKIFSHESGWTVNEVHHYLELPILLNMQFDGQIKKLGSFSWFFGAGPNLSYFLGGTGKLQTEGIDTEYEISYGGKESDYNYITFKNINRWQWGLDFNVGLISPLKTGATLVSRLKFGYGHTHLGQPNSSSMPILGFSDNLAHNYRTLSLTFSYMYGVDVQLFRKGKSTKGEKIKTKNVGKPPSTTKQKDINKIKKRKK